MPITCRRRAGRREKGGEVMIATVTESSVRGRANRRGYVIRKSRQRAHVPNIDNFGDYMLADTRSSFVVFGSRIDATLEEIDDFLINLLPAARS